MSGALAPRRFSREEARTLTAEVRDDAAALWAKLLQLYEGRAHTALDYPSWGAYFEAEFGQKKSQAYRLLEAARAVQSIPQLGNGISPNEAQARELARVEPERRAEVWRAASEDGPPTAARIREVSGAAPVTAAATLPIGTRPTNEAQARESMSGDRAGAITQGAATVVVELPTVSDDPERFRIISIGSALKIIGDAIFHLSGPESEARALAEDFTGPLAAEARAVVGMPTYPVTAERARNAITFLSALADHLEKRNGHGS